MPKYAKGSKAWGISDRSGFRYRLKDMRREWNGMLVGPDEYEPKHPQLEPKRIRPDATALRNPRPDRVEDVTIPLFQNVLIDDLTAPFAVGRVSHFTESASVQEAGIFATVPVTGTVAYSSVPAIEPDVTTIVPAPDFSSVTASAGTGTAAAAAIGIVTLSGDAQTGNDVLLASGDEAGGYVALPAVTNLLTAPLDQQNVAYETSGLTVTSGIADPFGGTNAFRLTDTSGFAYILQYYTSLGSGTVYYNDVWMRMVSAGGGTGISADVGLYHARLDWAEVTLTTNWNWYRIPRLGRTVGDNSWGINLQNNTVIEIYQARAYIDAYNGDPTYSLITGPYTTDPGSGGNAIQVSGT